MRATFTAVTGQIDVVVVVVVVAVDVVDVDELSVEVARLSVAVGVSPKARS